MVVPLRALSPLQVNSLDHISSPTTLVAIATTLPIPFCFLSGCWSLYECCPHCKSSKVVSQAQIQSSSFANPCCCHHHPCHLVSTPSCLFVSPLPLQVNSLKPLFLPITLAVATTPNSILLPLLVLVLNKTDSSDLLTAAL
jgi:hypothetical protein